MKKLTAFFLLTISFILSFTLTKADEGMWLPVLLKQLNEADMQSKGMKLSAEDIFSINKTSMKDAVVLFGGGCTGEIISDKGLLLTNHHCGFSQINGLSTLEKNYLRDGFWAKSTEEELPCPGLTVTFIINMIDVTDKIYPNLDAGMSEAMRNSKIRELSAELEREAVKGTHYEAKVQSFYYGTEFYLFVTETFKDIRLVGTPPNSIGNFGEETDNWMWPRHTGDFSMFRIYANAENKPATFSKENKPFKPRYFFPISLGGVKEGDFTMLYGFPGRTQEYLPSYAVDLLINVTNPNRVTVRQERMDLIRTFMQGNDTITLKYASKIRQLDNARKKWKGEMTGLKANDAIVKKQKFENDFQKWATTNENGKNYQNLLSDFKNIYTEYRPLSKIVDFTQEAALGVEIINYASNYKKLAALCKSDTASESTVKTEADKLSKNSEGFFKNYDVSIDKRVFAALLKIYSDSVDQSLQPEYFKSEVAKYKGDFNKWADAIFETSFMDEQATVKNILSDFSKKKLKKIEKDPAYKLWFEITSNYDVLVMSDINILNEKITKLQRQYMIAQRMMQTGIMFYPDANSTLRIAYGNVKGYYPRDGVFYNYATTGDGIADKHATGNIDYDAPQKLLDLIAAKNFGRYTDSTGHLPVAFIATNHSTGGNSGSPVLNAKGELIGTNYDRVWEGTMSDVMFDKDRCRNISLDVRYTLFIIEKFAGAKNIIDELKIVE